jgi:hypothetical protein
MLWIDIDQFPETVSQYAAAVEQWEPDRLTDFQFEGERVESVAIQR